MKQRILLAALLCMITGNVLFSQVTKKATLNKKDKLVFSNSLTMDDGWQIHRTAYRFQLEAKGYSVSEINEKMLKYDKHKTEFINLTTKHQSRFLELQIKLELQNKIVVLDHQTAVQKERMESLKQLAQKQELKAVELLKLVNSLGVHASAQKNQEVAMLEKAKTLSKQAATLKLHAKENWIKVKDLQGNFTAIFTKNLTFNGENKKVETLTFKVMKNKMIHLNMRGTLETGYALIEVRNPQGEKKGQLILDNSRQTDRSKLIPVSGSLNKYFKAEVIGEWQITITSTSPIGELKFSVIQSESDN